MAKGLRVRKKLYGRAAESSGGSVTPPGGADGAVQYNNGGAFGGFGNWDDGLLQFVLGGSLIVDDFADLVGRESAAEPNRKIIFFSDWGTGIGPYVSPSGNIDRNVFLTDGIQDSIVTILLFAQGINSNGARGISKLITASFRKDGAADPVQIGANTDLASKEDSPDAPTISIGLGGVGTDNIRVSYDSNNIGDIYTWTFMGIMAFTEV